MTMSEKTIERAAATESDPRWASVVARSAEADGSFFYSVRTTRVYCRPSCAARLARPENVRFHATREDAERAGFRPCKRCKPDQPSLLEQHAAHCVIGPDDPAVRAEKTGEMMAAVARLMGRK